MAQVGPARQPVDLLLFKGKKHLTKKEIEERREQEIKAPSDNIKYPSYLPKELRKEYNKISTALVKIGIFTNLDTDVLARFLIAREQYIRSVDAIREADIEDIIYYDRVLRVQDKLFNQVTKAATELGLSINARGKLLVPKGKTKDDEGDQVGDRFGV